MFTTSAAFAPEKISAMTATGATTVDITKAKSLFDKKVTFIDTHSNKNWGAGRIPGAMHMDLNKDGFTKDILGTKVKKDQEVVMYCNGEKCMRSSEASEQAIRWGYKSPILKS